MVLFLFVLLVIMGTQQCQSMWVPGFQQGIVHSTTTAPMDPNFDEGVYDMSDTESVIESAALATTPETEDYTESLLDSFINSWPEPEDDDDNECKSICLDALCCIVECLE